MTTPARVSDGLPQWSWPLKERLARWHEKSPFKKRRGVSLILHGLNLKPERMEPLILLLNRQASTPSTSPFAAMVKTTPSRGEGPEGGAAGCVSKGHIPLVVFRGPPGLCDGPGKG